MPKDEERSSVGDPVVIAAVSAAGIKLISLT